jgi:ubiquinone/menaquinone biosynthesis C-methylase UbiE
MHYISIDLGELPATVRMNVKHLAFFDDSLDLILCFHVLELVDDWRGALRELRRSLRAGGSLVLSETYAMGQPQTIELDRDKTFSTMPIRRFGEDLHLTLREMGFRVQTFDYLERNDESGDYFFHAIKNLN